LGFTLSLECKKYNIYAKLNMETDGDPASGPQTKQCIGELHRKGATLERNCDNGGNTSAGKARETAMTGARSLGPQCRSAKRTVLDDKKRNEKAELRNRVLKKKRVGTTRTGQSVKDGKVRICPLLTTKT